MVGSMTGGGLSDTDTDDTELSDSGPSGLDLEDDELGLGGQEDDEALGSDDDF